MPARTLAAMLAAVPTVALAAALALGLALPAAGAGPAPHAGDRGPPPPSATPEPPAPDPFDAFGHEMRRLWNRLEDWVQGLPRYEWPEMTPDGDIIMRRRPTPPPSPADHDRKSVSRI